MTRHEVYNLGRRLFSRTHKIAFVFTILVVNGRPSAVDLPAAVELAVVETEPGVKGDTVSNVTKPATLETGAVVQVPLFVNVGERIKVDPREGRYISRA